MEAETRTAHTPGPWVWRDNTLAPEKPDFPRSNVHSILDAEGGYGFLGSDRHATADELEADRRLIAAAPDLLDALRRIEELVHMGRAAAILDTVRVAILKATGDIA